MKLLRIGLAAFVTFSLAAVVSAQSSLASNAAPSPPELGEDLRLDVTRLPIDLERIQRKLRQSTIREEHQGLNLHYVVEVYGQAPPIVFFGPDDNLVYGPVPYGAPTHREMIEHVTPREYRAPVADLGALARWLAERAKK